MAMSYQSSGRPRILGLAIALVVGIHQALAFDIMPTPGSGDGIQFVKCERDYVTLVAASNGSLIVDGAGQIDILLIGGGGGGGLSQTEGGGAGGGAGGFVYKQSFNVTSGTYEVKVGKGGAVGVSGGDSTAFGLIAYGGGNGAKNRNTGTAGNGGSGGGASAAFDGTVGQIGEASYTAMDNVGHDGGVALNYRRPGGGGGAGEAGHTSVAYGGGGGKGKICSITGRAVWYAGGGAGTYGSEDKGGWIVDEATGDGKGGLGGGGNAGCAGADGFGGGGGGDAKGGDGVVVVRYRRVEPDVDADDFDIAVSAGGVMTNVLDGEVAMVFRQNGQFSVSGGGYVDVMMVGGGGGGGVSLTDGGGAGGGAGGFLYRQGIYVSPGAYSVEIGEGGAVGSNGGNTKALGFIAYGGGCGAGNRNSTVAGDGGSGGGQTETWNGTKGNIGQGVHAEEFNVGHSGGASTSSRRTGGGGGAGSVGGILATGSYGGPGGTGVVCRITGTDVWYAGGGAGTSGTEEYGGWDIDTVTRGGCGGLGGGGNAGCAGVDGLGGGGGGDAKGGSGVFVIRFSKKAYPDSYDDATGGIVKHRGGYRIHTFRVSGTFTMPSHAGRVDVLLVGGGGGGGASKTEGGGAGGGAGGLVYKESVFVEAGEHSITVGQGGDIGVNGGNSTAFGLVAYGGGNGANNRNTTDAGNGGSGGGATAAFNAASGAAGEAVHADADNVGHDGGLAKDYRRPGGGGGAGEEGHTAVAYGGGGGDGLSSGISGSEVWYAGGGAGTYGSENVVDEAIGDGKGGKGGGGNAGCAGVDGLGGGGGGDAKGGSGIVIIRYKTTPKGFQVIIK